MTDNMVNLLTRSNCLFITICWTHVWTRSFDDDEIFPKITQIMLNLGQPDAINA